MKAFIVYVKNNSKSKSYAKHCLASCDKKFDAELFDGTTPDTLPQYEEIYNFGILPNGRSYNFNKENINLYKIKKSCFMNHVRVWNYCIENNQSVAFIEHDSFCIKAWNNIEFSELLILNYKSAWDRPVYSHIWNDWRDPKPKPKPKMGKQIYDDSPLIYDKDNLFKGSLMIPGTAAYAITPKGALKLLSVLYDKGWDQSDYFINTVNVRIEYIQPQYFTFKLPNLNMSHGKFL